MTTQKTTNCKYCGSERLTVFSNGTKYCCQCGKIANAPYYKENVFVTAHPVLAYSKPQPANEWDRSMEAYRAKWRNAAKSRSEAPRLVAVNMKRAKSWMALSYLAFIVTTVFHFIVYPVFHLMFLCSERHCEHDLAFGWSGFLTEYAVSFSVMLLLLVVGAYADKEGK